MPSQLPTNGTEPNGPSGAVVIVAGPEVAESRIENCRLAGSYPPTVSRPSPSQSPANGTSGPFPKVSAVSGSPDSSQFSGPRSLHQLVRWVAPATENEKCTWVSWGSLVL